MSPACYDYEISFMQVEILTPQGRSEGHQKERVDLVLTLGTTNISCQLNRNPDNSFEIHLERGNFDLMAAKEISKGKIIVIVKGHITHLY